MAPLLPNDTRDIRGSMIDPLTFAGQPQGIEPRRKEEAAHEAAPGFSYALAAASLEKNASQSLKAHGAAPGGGETSAPVETAHNARRDRQATDNSQVGAKTAQQKTSQPAPIQPPATANRSDAAPFAASIAASAPPPTIGLATGPAAAIGKSADALAIRASDLAKLKTAAPKAPRIEQQAPALKAEFAEILARRLEKTSVFELRLDPPELGRVDGRLSVNDDGKAVLSLTFDNQNSFDLYSRDEQALRQALSDAGLNFAAGDFTFAFREPPAATVFQAEYSTPPLPVAVDAYEPLFLADWSAGALDIRI